MNESTIELTPEMIEGVKTEARKLHAALGVAIEALVFMETRELRKDNPATRAIEAIEKILAN